MLANHFAGSGDLSLVSVKKLRSVFKGTSNTRLPSTVNEHALPKHYGIVGLAQSCMPQDIAAQEVSVSNEMTKKDGFWRRGIGMIHLPPKMSVGSRVS